MHAISTQLGRILPDHGVVTAFVQPLIRWEAVRDPWNRRVVWRVCLVSDSVGRFGTVRVWILAVRHRVGVVERLLLVIGGDGAWADAARWLSDCRLAKRRRVDGRHPDARLVDAVELGDQILEVDVVLRVVVEDQLLEVPASSISRRVLEFVKDLGPTTAIQRPESPCPGRDERLSAGKHASPLLRCLLCHVAC